MSDTRPSSMNRAFESGKPAFTAFYKVDKQSAISTIKAAHKAGKRVGPLTRA
ncbi:hypothetical protein [Paraburkholderia aromaticivorans]|uniref:hypothetical protein n=1 Tax=Paraburkholderia aromaticivorans TaxID=2026199 RepID=UPI0038B9E542